MQGDALQALLSTPLAHILRPGLPATKSIQEGWQYLKYRVCVYMRLHVRLRVCMPKLVEYFFKFKKISSVAVRLRHQKSGRNKNPHGKQNEKKWEAPLQCIFGFAELTKQLCP